jgi:hypothetical protein
LWAVFGFFGLSIGTVTEARRRSVTYRISITCTGDSHYDRVGGCVRSDIEQNAESAAGHNSVDPRQRD